MLKNPKHEHFVHMLAKGEKAETAYIIAGFSKNGAIQGASRLLKNVEILARLAQLKVAVIEKVAEKLAIDKYWVMEQLIEIVAMGKSTELILDKDGGNTGEVKQNLAAANKALELIGKELAMFVDRKEIKTSVLDDVSTTTLLEMRAEIEAKRLGLH